MKTLWIVLVVITLFTGCFVDGKELIAPEHPRYAELCADTTITHDDYVCRPHATIGVTIPNPLYRDTIP